MWPSTSGFPGSYWECTVAWDSSEKPSYSGVVPLYTYIPMMMSHASASRLPPGTEKDLEIHLSLIEDLIKLDTRKTLGVFRMAILQLDKDSSGNLSNTSNDLLAWSWANVSAVVDPSYCCENVIGERSPHSHCLSPTVLTCALASAGLSI